LADPELLRSALLPPASPRPAGLERCTETIDGYRCAMHLDHKGEHTAVALVRWQTVGHART
jgi:hypothetical protein